MKRERRRKHNPVQASSDEGLEKAEQLAPLEERARKPAGQNSNNEGLMVVDTGDLKLPKDFTDKDEGKSHFLGFEPVALVILIFSLAFIIFIAYLISMEPSKAKDNPAPAAETQSDKGL